MAVCLFTSKPVQVVIEANVIAGIQIYICLNKIRSIVYSHTMGKKMLNMRKSNIPPHQLNLQKTTTYYTSLVRKLVVTLDTSISVSTISNPERLGYRWLKFVSQSSFVLVGVLPTVGLRS